MRNLVTRFAKNDEGAALIEYGMLVGLIAVVCVAAVGTLGQTILGYFTAINVALRIPNALVIAVAVLGLIRLVVIGDRTVALYTVGASLMVFVAAFLLFWRNFIGGGDAKLITATALLVGYHNLFSFLVLMSLCGVLVTLAVLATHRSTPETQPKARLAVPYGVAIAGGGIVTLLFQPSLLG